MTVALPEIRVGDPVRHESLSVFPLFADSSGLVEYRLSESALADESLLVSEVDQQGSVPDLLVENKGDQRVLFLEGEELIGAKQNRILNTSVLVAPHTKIKIPVSCVEQGRWRSTSAFFRSSGSHSPSKLRRALKKSVSDSVMKCASFESNQGEVWKEVASLQASHGVRSATTAMSDTFDSHQSKIDDYREKLQYVKGATGLAVAIGTRVVSIDLFDKQETCEKVWKRMLTGVVFDALEAGKQDKLAEVADVEKLVGTTEDLDWKQSDAVGEGDEYRAESEDGDHASALALEETVIHGSVLASV